MEVTFARVVKGFVFPVLVLVALTGNVLVLVVYCRQCWGGSSMRKSNNTFFISLSLTYIAVILMPLPWYIYAFTLGNMENNLTANMCFHDFMYGTLAIIPHSVTVLLACALSIQRYTAIRYPLRANVWWTYKKALLIVFVFYCIDIAIHVPGYLAADSLETGLMNFTSNITEEMKPGMCLAVLKYKTWVADPVMFGIIWLTLRNTFLGTIPNIVLVFFVIATVRHLRKLDDNSNLKDGSYHFENALTLDLNTQIHRHRQTRMDTPTRVISSIALTVTLVESITNIVVILNILQISHPNVVIYNLKWFRFLYQFQYIIIVLGTNTLFFHSCFLHASFRKELKAILSCFS